jgi:hypothetical protein
MIFWFATSSLVAFKQSISVFPKSGSAIIFLVSIASIFDYPARTPMIMAILVIAVVWLADSRKVINADGPC